MYLKSTVLSISLTIAALLTSTHLAYPMMLFDDELSDAFDEDELSEEFDEDALSVIHQTMLVDHGSVNMMYIECV